MADKEQTFGPFGQPDPQQVRDSLETMLQQGYHSYARANEESLHSVWGRLDTHLRQSQQKAHVVPIEAVRKRHERKPSMGEIFPTHKRTGRWNRLARTLSSLAAVLVVAVLAGSAFLLFNTGQAGRTTDLGKAPLPTSPGIYMTTAKDWDTTVVSKVDLNTHAVVWEHSDAKVGASVLTVYGDTVYYSASNDVSGDPQYQEKYVIALNANTGAVRWKANLGKSLVTMWDSTTGDSGVYDLGYLSQPRIADGLVYVVALTGKVTALNASDGKVSWTYDSGTPVYVNGINYGAPSLVADNGIVYVSIHNRLFALQAKNGEEAWNGVEIEPDQGFNNMEIMDGVLYASSGPNSDIHKDSYVAAYDAKNGDQKWRKHFQWYSYIALVADGKIYVNEIKSNGDEAGQIMLHVLDTNGRKIWDKDFAKGGMSRLVAENGVVYVSSDTYSNGQLTSYKLYALNADRGDEVWNIDTTANPAQVQQGILYTTYPTGIVRVYNATNGKEMWNAQYGTVLKDKMGGETAQLHGLVVVS